MTATTKQRALIEQLLRFALVGAVTTGLDWAGYFLLEIPLHGLGQHGKQLAKAGSFVVSAYTNYRLNRSWTFRSTSTQVGAEAARFLVVALIGLALNNSLFFFLTSPTGLHLSDMLGLLFSTVAVSLWNFLANKYWTFKA